MNGFAKALLDGWTVTTIFNARTGTPFTIFDGTNANLSSPRLVANGPLTVNVTDNGNANFFNYINLAGQPVGAFGNPVCGGCSDFGPYPAGMTTRNQFRGPGYWNIDAGVRVTSDSVRDTRCNFGVRCSMLSTMQIFTSLLALRTSPAGLSELLRA
jgi:hypothetical protein